MTESSAADPPPIRPLADADGGEWLRLRRALWPEATLDEHRAEMGSYFAQPRPTAVFVAPRATGGLRGFVEVSIRDYAEGCASNWIGYVEGWYVDADARRQGAGRALIAVAEAWATAQGCREMASDAELANLLSQEAHGRLGYAEVGRSVHFRKALPGSGGLMSENRGADRHLILVKHALPTVLPGIPPARWVLSDEGRASCAALAARLRPYHPTLIAASDEPKASETAHLLATALGHAAPIPTDHDLREHERRPEDFFDSTADFHDAVRRFFAQPDNLIFGTETATAAGARFAAAARRFVDGTPSGDIVIVAHGTVISLFVSASAGIDPFPLWRSLGLPSYVVLTLPGLGHVETWMGIGTG